MAEVNGGATLWARQTLESDVFYNKPDKWFKIWFYIVSKANHTNNKKFKRGSFFTKYEWIMEKCKATKSEVDHCMRWLKSATMIATQKATRGLIVSVFNYKRYQTLQTYKSDTKSDTNGDLKAKQKRNKSDTINKNDKNDKNEKNNIESFEKLWEKYPRKLGKAGAYTHFKAQVKSEKDLMDIQKALDNYLQSENVKEKTKFIQHGSTWFNNNWRDWIYFNEKRREVDEESEATFVPKPIITEPVHISKCLDRKTQAKIDATKKKMGIKNKKT